MRAVHGFARMRFKRPANQSPGCQISRCLESTCHHFPPEFAKRIKGGWRLRQNLVRRDIGARRRGC